MMVRIQTNVVQILLMWQQIKFSGRVHEQHVVAIENEINIRLIFLRLKKINID